MRILIAPDSFKDALRAEAVCEYIAAGVRRELPDATVDLCPVADGGEGFTRAITFGNSRAQQRSTVVSGPLGQDKQQAEWVMLMDQSGRPETAVIELASASGLELVKPEDRDPSQATTLGTGRQIAQAIEEGATRILLGIGGSATHDGATGIAQGLGVVFLDESNNPMINPRVNGATLQRVCGMRPKDPRKTFSEVEFVVACDVTNPLTGPRGAARVYGPQKGADPAMVEWLDAGLKHLARVWREQLGVDVEQLPGAGAAGGVGGGMVAMFGAELVSGAELVLNTVGFDARVREADLVITGEGRLDDQSLQGKAAMTVAKRAKDAGSPCVALVGSVGEGAERSLTHGLIGYEVIGPGLAPAESMRRTGELLEASAERVVGKFLASNR